MQARIDLGYCTSVPHVCRQHLREVTAVLECVIKTKRYIVVAWKWSLSTVAIVWDNVPCQADAVAKDRWSLREGGRWYRFHCTS